jgi:hypothetical protein
MALPAHGQMQDFENRTEGKRVQPHSLPDFTLVALHKNFELFSRNASLNVRFFLPHLPGNSNKKVFVEAVELKDSFHYYMRSKDSYAWRDGGWNTFQRWPTKDVIDGLPLNAENLGVRALYQIDNDRRVYLPVDVYQSGASPSQAAAYTFHFNTGQDLQSLDVVVTNEAGEVMNVPKSLLKCNTKFTPNCIFWAAGSTHHFYLNFYTLPEGQYHVKLVGHVPGNSTPTSFDVAIYHHP